MRTCFFLAVACIQLSAAPAVLSGGDARAAVTRALPVLSKSAVAFVGKRTCFSCHHNALAILTMRMAQTRGVSIDSAALAEVEAKTFAPIHTTTALDDAIQAVNLNDPTPDDSLLLMSAAAAGVPREVTLEVLARRLARWQRAGHWVTSDFRPPHSSSLFTATATAVRAIALYMPPELTAERDAVFARARAWLLATKPVSTEDAAFRLMGLAWCGASAADLAPARRDLLAMQLASGGWPQLSGYRGDAYSSGEALYALFESGTTAADPAWRRGEKFLLSTQAADGTWHVRTRMLSPADVSPRYFTTGFPYEKDEYLSYAGTCWAVMALLARVPVTLNPPARLPDSAPAEAPAWLRTALFGTSGQLESALANGLDAGADKLLAAVAHDPEKVKLLLARGARPDLGVLTIAAAYRDNSASVEAVLNAGIPADPPKGTRVKRSPLVLACSTGDLATVHVLLAHGADPSASSSGNTPIATAIMFGYPEIVRALIAAGANTQLKEATGVNLVHWATITGHADVIPVLAEAHVPVNATDENGFTPLMYAATIDFGDTSLVTALLKAGASRTIKSDDGRTPLQQAISLHHARLAAALR